MSEDRPEKTPDESALPRGFARYRMAILATWVSSRYSVRGKVALLALPMLPLSFIAIALASWSAWLWLPAVACYASFWLLLAVAKRIDIDEETKEKIRNDPRYPPGAAEVGKAARARLAARKAKRDENQRRFADWL